MNNNMNSAVAHWEYRGRLGDFLNFFTVEDSYATIPHVFLYTIYQLWTEEAGEFVMSKIAFGSAMELYHFERSSVPLPGQNCYCRGFLGITLAPDILSAVLTYLAAPDADKPLQKKELIKLCKEKQLAYAPREGTP